MLSLRAASFVEPRSSVRALARLAGIRGVVSLRELILLLGDARFGPAPFYVIGHNTNSLAQVRGALSDGANAVEVDVTAFESNLGQLCIDHAGVTGDAPGHDEAPRFAAFLRGLRAIVDQDARLALVVFDCKPPAATPEHGQTALAAIRSILTAGTRLNVIISVGDVTSSTPYKLNGTTIFDRIAPLLEAREGLMIDAQDDPGAVATFFDGRGVERSCYGEGTSFPLLDESAMVYRTPIEQACWMRATRNGPRFVYAWTVNKASHQRLYLRVGVNGMIADPEGIHRLVGLLKAPEFAARHRLATRDDNPFLPPNAAYGLTVQTSDVRMGGTDANLSFTLTGARGTSAITVDANLNRRMERGQRTFVVVPSGDLGDLRSVTVQRDDAGNAPDWHLATIVVESWRYHARKIATFDCWIGGTPVTRELA